MKNRFLLIASVCVCIACEEDDQPCDYSVCDIQDNACVEETARVVACHMDESLSLPRIAYLTRDELQAEFDAAVAEMSEEEALVNWALHQRNQLLGLEPEGYTDAESTSDYIDSAPAFYDYSNKEIVIVDGGFGDDVENYLMLVHELVHAVQYQRWDLMALREEYSYTADREFGIKSVIEGEATLYALLANLELEGYPIEPFPFEEVISEWQRDLWEMVREEDNPGLYITRTLPYAYGLEFVYDAWDFGGAAEIERLYQMPPDSSRAVSLGFYYWLRNGPSLNDDSELARRGAPILPSRFQSAGATHAGVWYVTLMAERTGYDLQRDFLVAPEFNEIPADVLTTFVDQDTEEVVAVWRIAASDSTNELADYLFYSDSSIWEDIEGLDGERATHVMGWAEDDLVLVATTGSDATTLFDLSADWQSIEEMEAEGDKPDASWGFYGVTRWNALTYNAALQTHTIGPTCPPSSSQVR